MPKRYLAPEYLQRLLHFVVEEHFAIEAEALGSKVAPTATEALFHKLASQLWGDRKKGITNSKSGPKVIDEERRGLILLDWMKRNPKASQTEAFQTVSEWFPLAPSKESDIQRLRRWYRVNKNRTDFLPLFSISNVPESLDAVLIQSDGVERFNRDDLPTLIQRIEKSLRQLT